MSQETTNPWDSGTAASSQAAPTSSGGADAWGTPDGSATPDAASSSDWLNSAPAPAPEHFNIMDPFHKTWIPLDHWVTTGIDWWSTISARCFRVSGYRLTIFSAPFSSCCWGCPRR